MKKDQCQCHDGNCGYCVEDYRLDMANQCYSGSCPFGYGDCYDGQLCELDGNEAALFQAGSTGCAYTTPPR